MQNGAAFDPFASLGSAVLTPTPVGAASSSRPVLKAKVNFDYTAQAANQISLKAGWIIEVVTQGEPGGWTKGKDLQGMILSYFFKKQCVTLKSNYSFCLFS